MFFKFNDLQCDNPSCDHYEEMEFSKYKESVNKPCPKCGDNLLTEEDYLYCKKIMDFQDKIEKFFYPLRWLNPFYYIKGSKTEEIIEDAIPDISINLPKKRNRQKFED